VSALFNQVTVQRLRYAIQQRIGRQVAESLRVEEYADVLTGDIVAALEVGLFAEQLPPTHLDDVVEFEVPRFATWRDHFAATYRQRWWGRWLREPRFIDETHSHRTRVDVLTRWTYPRATTVLPGRDYGHVVLKSDAAISWDTVTPW